jgi:hypothetical protein
MMPRKLTQAQQARIREVVRLRKAIPTNAQLAEEMDCSKALIDMFTAGYTYKNVEPKTRLEEAFLELGLAKP